VIELYSYREFLELQRRSLEHYEEKMKRLYEKAQKESKKAENKKPPEDNAPLGNEDNKT